MNPRRVAAVALRQFYLMRGSLARVMPLFAWVAVDIVLWGFLTRWLNTLASPGFSFVAALLGAVLFWDYFTRVMQGVSKILPPSYVFESLRAIVANKTAPPHALVWGAGLGVLYLLAAGRIFVATFRHGVRTGLIARYAAETVS